jgi:hypothetical protein
MWYYFPFMLHQMNKGKSKSSEKTPTDKDDKVGELFPAASLEEYAKQSRNDNGDDDNDEDEDLILS